MICGGCDCIYRGFLSSGTSTSFSYCDKLCMTGQSTLKWFYDQHNINGFDEHWKRVWDETECPFYKRSKESEKREARRARNSPANMDEGKAFELYKAGFTDYKIACLLRTTTSRVKLWRKHNGLPSQHEKNLKTQPPFDQKRAKQLYEQGMTDGEIAEQMKCSRKTVGNWRRLKGLPHHRKKPQLYDWELAYTLYADGKTDIEIAEALGCSKSGVRNWKERTGLIGYGRR